MRIWRAAPGRMSSVLYALLIILFALVAAYWLFPNQLVRLAIAAGRRSARLRANMVIVDGDEWHYLEGGPDGADTILLVHGFGTDKDSWLLYARELTRRFRVIAPDLPGHGETARHFDRDYTVSAQTVRLRTFVDALGLDNFHIVGNSMGGHISGLYALAHPAQLKTLALFNNAGVDVPTKSELVQAIDEGKNPLVVSTLEELEQMMAMVTYRKIWMPGFIKRFAYRRAAADREFLDYVFWSIVEESPHIFLNDRLSEISVPTLILWGRHDNLIDVSCVDVLAAAIPDNASVILEETGHAPMIEHPKVTAQHHINFIAKRTGALMPA